MLNIVSLTPPKTFLVTRKILAPGEEENLELEEDEEDGAGVAGSTEVLPSRSPGTACVTITVSQAHALLEGSCSVVCRELLWGCLICTLYFCLLCRSCAWLSHSFLLQPLKVRFDWAKEFNSCGLQIQV